ncbi:MAG: PilT protein domain protein [Myxococcales bacterium]|nr:PilT protein domain protein [Myxococcales bacterium]
MIFVDAGVFYARLALGDEHHREALDFLRQNREPRLTTTAVVYEAHALLLRIDRGAAPAQLARRFLDEVEGGMTRLVHVSRDDHRRAVELIRAHVDKTYSLCDAVSFVVMERLRIGRAASFDHHFRQYGRFEVLP